jgi:predicted amidohydrolase
MSATLHLNEISNDRKTLRIGIFQTAGAFGKPSEALDMLEVAAAQAHQQRIDILVLPELFLTGYNLGKPKALALATFVAGDSLTRAHNIAKEHNIALVFGYPELVGDKVANAALFIGADGKTVLNYRKVHLYGDLDRQMFEVRGSEFPVVAYLGWNIGLAICYDIEFPETGRLLAIHGADCILVPTALMPPYTAVPCAVVPARGYEEQVYIAYANHCGAEADISYIGQSCICGPDGTVLATAGEGQELISAVIDKAAITAARAGESLLGDRRPELYHDISA